MKRQDFSKVFLSQILLSAFFFSEVCKSCSSLNMISMRSDECQGAETSILTENNFTMCLEGDGTVFIDACEVSSAVIMHAIFGWSQGRDLMYAGGGYQILGNGRHHMISFGRNSQKSQEQRLSGTRNTVETDVFATGNKKLAIKSSANKLVPSFLQNHHQMSIEDPSKSKKTFSLQSHLILFLFPLSRG